MLRPRVRIVFREPPVRLAALASNTPMLHRRCPATILVALFALALASCGDPTDPTAPAPSPDTPATAVAGGLAISTSPRTVIADFETELAAAVPTRGVLNVEWRFADGSVARGARVRHTFRREGRTTVVVRATDETGHVTARAVELRVGAGIATLAQTLRGIVPGGVHTCAIDAAAALWCWGFNGNGNLGIGSTTNTMSPVAVSGGISFAQIATGFSHSCALTTTGAAYCWGRNLNGQLGDGTKIDRSSPTPVSTTLSFASIDVGFSHSCGVTEAGATHCWGSNSLGQLGAGALVSEQLTPGPVSGGPAAFSYVRAGYNHTCGLDTAGTVWCWGANNRGQAGNGLGGLTETDRVTTPTSVTAPGAFTDLDVGGTHNCGIISQQVYCWGWNGAGQLGSASSGSCVLTQPCTRAPKVVSGGLLFSATSSGSTHSCALQSNGDAYCWGHNGSGQLGDGTTAQRASPTKVTAPGALKTIRAGGSYSCAIGVDDRAYCWGSNNTGKLGLGDTSNRLTPVSVPGLTF